MNIIEQDHELSKTQTCLSCLCHNDDRNLQCFKLQSKALKAIFQVDQLCLCYLCKRVIENAELFIQTVLSNQIFFENFKNISDETVPPKSQTQSICNLRKVTLDTIQVDGNDTQTAESILVYKHGVYSDCQVKEELEDEDENSLDIAGNDFMDNETVFTDDIKEEEYEMKNGLKIELDSVKLELDLEHCRDDSKKRKFRRKCGRTRKKVDVQGAHIKEDSSAFLNAQIEVDQEHGTKKIKQTSRGLKRKYANNNVNLSKSTFNIEYLYITKAQCMEERARKAKEKRFLNSAYKCMDCVKGFTFKPSYDTHLELHSKEMGDHECNICKIRMDTEYKLLRHKRYHQKRYKCVDCGLVRSNKTTIMDHYTAVHSTSGTDLYICQLCSKTFKRQMSLRKHISYMHKYKGRVTCAYCIKSYANKDVLKAHMKMSHPKEVSAVEVLKKWACKDCGKGFKSPSHLKMHMSKHSVARDYYCVECDKSFKTGYSLKQHLKISTPHVNYKDLPLSCSSCDKRFAIKRDLERHTNRMHLNFRPFPCDKCDKAYLNNWSLKQHTLVAHEGYKRPLKFPCPMCDKIFDRNCTLKGHIRTHTGERPYQCNKCPAKFTQSGVLNTHRKLVHLKLTREGKPKATSK